MNDGDERGAVVDGSCQPLGRNDAIRFRRHATDGATLLLQQTTAGVGRGMLDVAGDNGAARTAASDGATDRQVAGFRCAAGEHDLFGLSSDQRGNLTPCTLDGCVSAAAERIG